MSMTVIIECISWLIKVTDYNDAQWKFEIDVIHVLLRCHMLLRLWCATEFDKNRRRDVITVSLI